MAGKPKAESREPKAECQFFHAHEPGPSGLPHDPHGPAAIGPVGIGEDEPLADTANTESLGSSSLLSHFGQTAFCLP